MIRTLTFDADLCGAAIYDPETLVDGYLATAFPSNGYACELQFRGKDAAEVRARITALIALLQGVLEDV